MKNAEPRKTNQIGKKQIMLKSTNSIVRLSASVCMSAVLGVSGLVLTPQTVRGDTSSCQAEAGAGVDVTPFIAHTNDIITINLLKASVANNDCSLVNVIGFLVKPDNSSQLVITNCTLDSGPANVSTTFSCPTNQPGATGTGTCIGTVSYTYQVRAVDVGQGVSFTSVYHVSGSPDSTISQSQGGQANMVTFMAVSA